MRDCSQIRGSVSDGWCPVYQFRRYVGTSAGHAGRPSSLSPVGSARRAASSGAVGRPAQERYGRSLNTLPFLTLASWVVPFDLSSHCREWRRVRNTEHRNRRSDEPDGECKNSRDEMAAGVERMGVAGVVIRPGDTSLPRYAPMTMGVATTARSGMVNSARSAIGGFNTMPAVG